MQGSLRVTGVDSRSRQGRWQMFKLRLPKPHCVSSRSQRRRNPLVLAPMAEVYQHFDQRDPRRYEQRLAASRLGPEWSQDEWRKQRMSGVEADGGRADAKTDATLIGGSPDDSARREALFPNRGIRGAQSGEYTACTCILLIILTILMLPPGLTHVIIPLGLASSCRALTGGVSVL